MTLILQKVPLWVWPLFFTLIVFGLRMARTRNVPPQPVIVISTVMLCLSGYSVISAFKGSLPAMLVWAFMLCLALLICQRMGYPKGWLFDADTRRMHVPGSWLPMVLFMTIFFIKFSVGMTLAIQPALAFQSEFTVVVSALYGLLSGIFAARALHALRISRRSPEQDHLPAQ